jgi:predicted RND superfamily exporter protein
MRPIHRPLLIFVLHVVKHPLRVLMISLVLVAVCVAAAMWKLNISTEQNKLFDPNVEFFRQNLEFTKKFPENEATYILIETTDPKASPPAERWTGLADEIAARLNAMPKYVKSVDSRVPTEQLGSQGLLFDEPANVQQHFEDIKRFIPLVKLWAEKPGLKALLGRTPIERFLNALRTQKPDEETGGFVTLLAKSWNAAIEHPDAPLQPGSTLPDLSSAGASDPLQLGYYYQPDESDPSRHLMLVRVFERAEYNSMTAISETIEAIRDTAKDVAKDYPEFTVAITGRPALEADEMRTTDRDSHKAEIIAMIAVLIGLIIMLRSIWLALAGEIALCVGIGWTFGWATISIGELNLLSIVFLLALIGIGMDYLVQILTRYRQEMARRSHPETVWVGVFHHVALPINTACLGAAGAFLVSVLTHFRGAAQLGIIAGGGLLLCLLAGYVVLPSLLTLIPLRIERGDELPDLGPPARGGKNNLILPAIWMLLLALGIPFMQHTKFDPGLLTMQAPNLESVQVIHKLQTWSAVVLSKDLNVLREARSAVQDAPTVQNTDSILKAYDNLTWLQAHEKELPTIAWTDPPTVTDQDLSRIADAAKTIGDRFSGEAHAELLRFSENVRYASPQHLSAWQVAFIGQLHGIIDQFHPQGLDESRLPHEMKIHFIGTDGTYALYIHPKEDLWQQARLVAFVTEVERRMASVPGDRVLTGIAINIFHSTASIERSFHHATVYALVLILILVFLDLKNLRQTFAAVSVLALGLPMLVAMMGLLHVDWNFANFFGLPILIGAGHEYGVFLVHRYREACHDERRPWRRWDVSDRALLLCAYVTCSSFGFFWAVAHHGGLRSLGAVMALGTACIYLSSLMVLRPLLVYRLRKGAKECVAVPVSAR